MFRAAAAAFCLFLSTAAFAAPLDNDIARLAAIAKAAGNRAEIRDFDRRDFSNTLIFEALKADLRSKDPACKLNPVSGNEHLVIQLELFASFIDRADEVQAIVKRLDRSRQLVGGAGYYWDGFDGDEDKCDIEFVALYFNNGKVLTVRRP